MKSTPFEPGSYVAAYLRDSGGDEQELSVARQESELRRWCSENGLIPGRIFKDEARPGSNMVGRFAFQEMMSYFRLGKVQEAGLVIWNYQRFARQIDDSQFFRADLRRRGYIFHSMNDDVPEGPLGRLYEAVLDWKNEQFLVDMSRDVKSGLRMLVEQYGAVPGTPPRGFVREPIQISNRRDGRPRVVHRWVPDPDMTYLIRQAFQMLLDGKSLAEIQDTTHLYKGINCYRTFFSNPIYMGELHYGDLVVEGYCEPIISHDTWERTQILLEKRSQMKHLKGDNPMHPRRSILTYLLSGLLYCARCGSPMCGLSVKKVNGGYYERYACGRSHRNRDCDAQPIPRIFLENVIIEKLKDYMLTYDYLNGIHQTLQESGRDLLENLERSQSAINQRLIAVRRRLSNVAEAFAEEGKSIILQNKLKELEQEERELLSEENRLRMDAERANRVESASLTGVDIDAMVDRLKARLTDSNPLAVRSVLRGLIERINVERDGQVVRVQIRYYYPPEERPPPDSAYKVGDSLGALDHRHSFSYSFTTLWKRKKRTGSK